MQKTITVVVAPLSFDNDFTELEFPEVNKLLAEGYKIIEFYQLGLNPGTALLTYKLSK